MSEKNNRFKGTVGTIAFHLLALLAILYFALSTPLPLPGEEGVEVNLGSSNVGMGQVQEQSPPPVQQPIPQPPPPQNDPEPEPEEDIITQDVEETPAIEEEIEEKEEEVKQEEQTTNNEEQTPVEEIVEEVVEEVEPEPEPPKVNQRALYKGNTDTDGDGSNQGETGQPGDQGKPDGTINSRNYEGSGKGDQGIGYDLGGRGALSLSKPVYTSDEVGTVKIKVWVNKSGQVTKAVFEMKGSNNSSPALVDEAIKAALKSKFEADPNAPETQIGYITYNFIRIN
jgi:outer membrane biosynthesis protein TonB